MTELYYSILTDYLRKQDERVQKLAPILDVDISKDSTYEEIDKQTKKAPQFFTKKQLTSFSAAMQLYKQRWPGFSEQLIEVNIAGVKDDIVRYKNSFNREQAARFLLAQVGYDIGELESSKDIMQQELRNWMANPEYYVPVRDFFDPSFSIDTGTGKEYSNPLRHVKNFAKEIAFPAIAMPFIYIQGLVAGALHLIPFDKMRDDINRLFNTSKQKVGDGFKGLFYIAEYKPAHDLFFVEYITSDYHDPADNKETLQAKGLITWASQIDNSVRRNWEIKLKFLKNAAPTDITKLFVPLNHAIHNPGDDLTEITYRQGKWILPLTNDPITAKFTIPQDLEAIIEEHKTNKSDIEKIRKSIQNYFKYDTPDAVPELSRFEAAAEQKKGVCQDINMWYLYALRSAGIPSHYAVGMVGKSGKISIRSGHVNVLVYNAEEKEWEISDATSEPVLKDKKSSWRLPNFNIHLPRFPKPAFMTKYASSIANGAGKAIHATGTLYDKLALLAEELKEVLRKKALDTQISIYKPLLTRYKEDLLELEKVTDSIPRYESLSLDDILELKQDTIHRKRKFQSVGNVYFQDGDVKITGFFRPKRIREMLPEIEYFTDTLPEFLERYNKFTQAQDVVDETLAAPGQLLPFHKKDRELWTKVILDLFKRFGVIERPKHPQETSTPSRWFFRPKNSISRWHTETKKNGEEVSYKIEEYKPSWVRPVHLNDPRVFIDNVTNTQAQARIIYGASVPNNDRKWYELFTEDVKLHPGKTHYTLSPEIMAFDKQWAVDYQEYWKLLGQVIRKHMQNSESTFTYLGQTLEKLKADFDDETDIIYLRIRYLRHGFPEV